MQRDVQQQSYIPGMSITTAHVCIQKLVPASCMCTTSQLIAHAAMQTQQQDKHGPLTNLL